MSDITGQMTKVYPTRFYYRGRKARGGGVHNMLRVRVCAAHMGGFLGPKFSKQWSLFRQIFLKQGWVIQELSKNSKNWVVSDKIHHKGGYDGNFR